MKCVEKQLSKKVLLKNLFQSWATQAVNAPKNALDYQVRLPALALFTHAAVLCFTQSWRYHRIVAPHAVLLSTLPPESASIAAPNGTKLQAFSEVVRKLPDVASGDAPSSLSCLVVTLVCGRCYLSHRGRDEGGLQHD